eukprot:2279712-Prymnesium_polylepis.1
MCCLSRCPCGGVPSRNRIGQRRNQTSSRAAATNPAIKLLAVETVALHGMRHGASNPRRARCGHHPGRHPHDGAGRRGPVQGRRGEESIQARVLLLQRGRLAAGAGAARAHAPDVPHRRELEGAGGSSPCGRRGRGAAAGARGARASCRRARAQPISRRAGGAHRRAAAPHDAERDQQDGAWVWLRRRGRQQ